MSVIGRNLHVALIKLTNSISSLCANNWTERPVSKKIYALTHVYLDVTDTYCKTKNEGDSLLLKCQCQMSTSLIFSWDKYITIYPVRESTTERSVRRHACYAASFARNFPTGFSPSSERPHQSGLSIKRGGVGHLPLAVKRSNVRVKNTQAIIK